MKRLLCVIGALILLALTSFAEAKKQIHKQQINNGAMTHEFSQQKLFIYVDPNKIAKLIPRLQKAKLIDPNLSTTEMEFYQPLLAAFASIPYAVINIRTIYERHPSTEKIYVATYLLGTDLYGNNKSRIFCYSFEFDNALYKKINWSNFHSTNIIKLAPNFNVSDTCRGLKETDPLHI
ncbi:hypothetical protein [Legionella fallonii]|uniref:Uncharacterized protein n=1 Tax=Legionella fallonii LLAP-10 TaxID=1212491 RepID=A0A098G0Q1_9GAMM|nr:hypothetical protein [Legionella fallonii]CEG56092.1 conserved exported protein of unknown function [Legionella fallonii LLAP-10]